MAVFWKVIGATLVGAVLWLSLEKQQKDLAVLLTLSVCVMGCMVLLSYLEPVLELLRSLEKQGRIPGELVGILLKCLGAGMAAELAATVCADAGNTAMGKMVKMLGSGVMLFLSLPLVESLLRMIQEILRLL